MFRRLRLSAVVTALGLTVALSTAALVLVDSDFVKVFVPVRTVGVLGGVAAAGLLLMRLALPSRPSARGRAILLVGAPASLALAAWIYHRDFMAYREEPVEFLSDGVRLSGSIYVPEGTGPFPAVVIAQGSLRAPRRVYHAWADRLVRAGIAVLSFDKRGTGQSGGEYESQDNSSSANLHRLAADVSAATDALAARQNIDARRVGIVGISMGGWLAPIAAQQNPRVRFFVCVSGPAVSVGEEGFYSELTGEGAASSLRSHRREVDERVAARAPSGFDPRLILAGLSIPTFWIFGSEDTSVPVTKSLAVLDGLRAPSHSAATYRVFAGADHLIVIEQWPFRFAPGFLEALTSWILAR